MQELVNSFIFECRFTFLCMRLTSQFVIVSYLYVLYIKCILKLMEYISLYNALFNLYLYTHI